jgi:hypothetical protein
MTADKEGKISSGCFAASLEKPTSRYEIPFKGLPFLF